MAAISARVVNEFCARCDSAYQATLVHRTLFDDNPQADIIGQSRLGNGYGKLSEITQEYALLQIVKLHDPSVMSGKITLGIAYVVTYGGWDVETQKKLNDLSKELEAFASKLRTARNQALAHNDLAAILAAGTLGSFEKNEEKNYFSKLEEFADTVSRKSGGPGFAYEACVVQAVAAMAIALGAAVVGE
jgi:AbiU2